MEDLENQYKNQSRSNYVYGVQGLKTFELNPKLFVVNESGFSRQKKALIRAMADINGKRVLEFGSGQGIFAVAMAKLGAIVTGIDLGKDLVELSKKVAEVNNVGIDFIFGNIRELPFEDNAFDFVVGNGVLHHLPRNWLCNSLAEAYRVLKPGGKAMFTEPIENIKIFDFIQNLVPVGEPNSPQYRPSILQRKKWKHYAHTVDDRSLSDRELIEDKGDFKYVKLEYYGFLIRLGRLCSTVHFIRFMELVDCFLTHKLSPVKKLSQCVLVEYSK